MRANNGKIMEISDSHAVVMTRDGHFNRIKRKESMRIGANVIYTSNDLVEKSYSRRWVLNFKAQVAVAMFLLLALVISQVAMPAAYAVVSLDINPSLEIIVDESRKVVSINPINTEADELLEGYVLSESKDLHAVINDLIRLSSAMGYLTSENHNVIIATATIDNKNSDSGSNELMNEILGVIEETEYTFDFTLVSTVREPGELENAKSEGLSLGRYVMDKENFLPPGQEKKLEKAAEMELLETIPVEAEQDEKVAEPKVEPALPPGLEKKVDANDEVKEKPVPPGLEKKVEANDEVKEKAVPPGQEMKEKKAQSKYVITEKKATPNPPGKSNDKGNNKGDGKGN